jgi:hypothetical protein
VQAGKMSVIAPPPAIEMVKPIGMPESKWIVLDDNDDIPPTGLFVGHNGNGFLIQTGIPASVPSTCSACSTTRSWTLRSSIRRPGR